MPMLVLMRPITRPAARAPPGALGSRDAGGGETGTGEDESTP
jgi:hypothetical protein